MVDGIARELEDEARVVRLDTASRVGQQLAAHMAVRAVPTLVVHGAADVRAPRSVADALVAEIPDADLVVLDGAGHLVNIDAPEQLASEIRAFLTRRVDG